MSQFMHCSRNVVDFSKSLGFVTGMLPYVKLENTLMSCKTVVL